MKLAMDSLTIAAAHPASRKTELTQCRHCGSDLAGVDSEFCCSGCEVVFSLLSDSGLPSYAEMGTRFSDFIRRPAREEPSRNFTFLDDPDFLNEFDPSGVEVELFLEGIHCAACVGLIEELPRLVPGLVASRLNFAESVVRLTKASRDDETFAAAAQTLSLLGYRSRPIPNSASRRQALKASLRKDLIRVAVAGVAAGNVMLLSFSIYAGLSGTIAKWFDVFSLLLSVPALTYGALPIYQSALGSIRTQRWSIDLPIALALVGGGLLSASHVIGWGGANYFDSLTVLVFLLLASRYVLGFLQRKSLSSKAVFDFLVPPQAFIESVSGHRVQKTSNALSMTDTLWVRSEEVLPVDGVVMRGSAWMDQSTLTGEARLVQVKTGDAVFCGTRLVSGELRLKPTALPADSRMGRLARKVEIQLLEGSQHVQLADDLSKWFVLAMVALSSLAAVAIDLSTALAMLIVSCPCGFALATPLALIRGVGAATRRGVLIQSSSALERLSGLNRAVFDKTGTLTKGNFQVQSWRSSWSEPRFKAWVYALEEPSAHPIARALRHWAGQGPRDLSPEVKDWTYEPTVGIRARVGEQIVTLGRADEATDQTVALEVDGKRVGSLTLGDAARPGLRPMIRSLRASGIRTAIASGDSQPIVDRLARDLGIDEGFGELHPEQKADRVDEETLFVGDGANDSLALSRAGVGVAVSSSLEVSLRAADVRLQEASIRILPELIELSRGVLKLIRRNFTFSVIYNGLGVTAAWMGYISPLFAAILMPLSATSVFVSTAIANRTIRRFTSAASTTRREVA
jgi:heavy metal translocating P-type ATPase